MTINLLTKVPDGMVLLADSMLTLTLQGTTLITTFENAEKLIELGSDQTPAAAMISGVGDVNGSLVSSLLRKAGVEVDRLLAIESMGGTSVGHDEVALAVRTSIEPNWALSMAALRIRYAAEMSQLDQLSELNAHRARVGLDARQTVEPKDVFVQGERDNDEGAFLSISPTPLTVVVASYFRESPRATELTWPSKIMEVEPPLKWWGAGGTAISRLVLGFDLAKLGARVEEERATAGSSEEDAEKTRSADVLAYIAEIGKIFRWERLSSLCRCRTPSDLPNI